MDIETMQCTRIK